MVEGSTCPSKLFCWGTSSSSGGDSVSGTPTCVNLDSLPGANNAKTYTGSSSGLFVTEISGGWNHYCALLSNHQLACWGANNQNVMTETVGAGASFTAGVGSVHCGSYSTCILPRGFNGLPVCWGYDTNFNTPSSYVAFNPIYASSHGYFYCFGGPNGETGCGGYAASTNSISLPNPFNFLPYTA